MALVTVLGMSIISIIIIIITIIPRHDHNRDWW
jgi:hypothetical protein